MIFTRLLVTRVLTILSTDGVRISITMLQARQVSLSVYELVLHRFLFKHYFGNTFIDWFCSSYQKKTMLIRILVLCPLVHFYINLSVNLLQYLSN